MTNHERREGQPSKKEKGTKDIKLLNTFREIWRALKEWSLTDEQKQELGRRKDGLIDKFHAETDYGRKTQEKNQEVSGVLEKALDELQGTSQKEFKGRARNTQETIRKKREEAKEHWENEPQDLDEKYKEIAEYELSETLRKAEKRQKEIKGEKGEKEAREREVQRRKGERGPLKTNPAFREGVKRNCPGASDEDIDRLLEETVGMSEEERTEALRHQNEMAQMSDEELRERRRRLGLEAVDSIWGLSKEEKGYIKEKNFEKIDELFNSFFATADTIPHMRFYEVLTTQERSRLNDFFAELIRQSREEKKWTTQEVQHLVNRYSQEYVMRNLLHDAVYIVERGGGKPEQLKQFMALYTSELHNFLFKAPGAPEAARLWEKTFYRLLDEDGYVDYSRVCLNPEEAGRGALSEVEEWVYEGLKESLRLGLKDKLREGISDEEFEEEFKDNWPEWKIRRAMALGKGHGIVTMRLVEIAAKGRLPPEDPEAAERMPSQWADNFVRTIDATEHLLEKFGIGGPALAILYTVIEGKPGNWRTTKELFDSLRTLEDPENKRIVDLYNLFKAGGPTTNSTWRGIMISKDISPEDLEKQGTLYRLLVGAERAEKEFREHLKSQGKTKKQIEEAIEKWKEMEKGKEGGLFEYKKEVWQQALERNPLQVLREYATLDYGREAEIRDRVLKKFLEKTDQQDKFDQIKFSDTSDKVRKARKDFLDPIFQEIDLGQERVVEKQADSIDNELSETAQKWVKSIREVLDEREEEGSNEGRKAVEILAATSEFRAGLGTDDVDWTLFDFSKTGPSGFIDRRSRDLASAQAAGEGLGEFLDNFARYRNEKEMARFLDDLVFKHVRDYNRDTSSDLAELFYEGICRFNSADTGSKLLPEPFYSLHDMWRVNSPAEAWLGNDAPAWWAWDKREFFNAMRATGSFQGKGIEDFKKIEKRLRRRAGATIWHIAGESAIRFHLLIGAFIIYAIWKEIEKGIEETAEAA